MIHASVRLQWHTAAFMSALDQTLFNKAGETGQVVQRQIRRLIQVQGPPRSRPGEPPHKDTTALYQSIAFEVHRQTGDLAVDIGSDKNVRASVSGTNENYALGLELGTSRTAPRPYLRRGLMESVRDIIRVLRRK